jgi:hypothetical protein
MILHQARKKTRGWEGLSQLALRLDNSVLAPRYTPICGSADDQRVDWARLPVECDPMRSVLAM